MEDKLGFLLPASGTIPPADMEEITRLFTPPPRVPHSDPPRYSPDPEVIISATSESLTHSSFASMRHGAWFDSHVINYILKVLVQPSVKGMCVLCGFKRFHDVVSQFSMIQACTSLALILWRSFVERKSPSRNSATVMCAAGANLLVDCSN